VPPKEIFLKCHNMTPKALKVHLIHMKGLKINSFVASIPPMICFIMEWE
jgi:hypothetical protein